jgi:hypothetical protein
MVLKQKYVRTSDDRIIVFTELIQHKEFKNFNPVSAGFISFSTKKVEHNTQYYYETDCKCYGESVSLNLKSNEEEDTFLARKQILGHY